MGSGGGGFHDPFDMFREVYEGGGSGGGFGGIFDELFGGGRSSQGGARAGANLQYDLEITLSEAANGVGKQISFEEPSAVIPVAEAVPLPEPARKPAEPAAALDK